MLRATADGLELYLAFRVSGDYAELLQRVVSKQFLVEGEHNQVYWAPPFASPCGQFSGRFCCAKFTGGNKNTEL